MIEVRNLTKYFEQTLAVDNITFSVKKGEVLGFLGPNGAGKSTTMRIITGIWNILSEDEVHPSTKIEALVLCVDKKKEDIKASATKDIADMI